MPHQQITDIQHPSVHGTGFTESPPSMAIRGKIGITNQAHAWCLEAAFCFAHGLVVQRLGKRACDVCSSFKRTSTPFRTRPQVFFGDVRWDSKSKTVVLEGLCAEPDKYTTEVLQAPLEVLANYFGVRVVFTLGMWLCAGHTGHDCRTTNLQDGQIAFLAWIPSLTRPGNAMHHPAALGNTEAWRHTLALLLFSLPQRLPYLLCPI